jgi:hypothetical protein
MTSAAGTYDILPSLTDPNGTLTNYTVYATNGTLEITRAPLTITADNKARAYGVANPTFTVSYSGFVGGETESVLSGVPYLSTGANLASPPGTYAISAAVGSLSSMNYSFIFVSGTLTIGKPSLTVTANNVSRAYGSMNPVFTVSYSGFLTGDGPWVLTGTPEFACNADTNSPVAGNPYTIALTSGTLTSTNYDLVFVDGQLTVTQAVLTVQADNKTKTYGAPVPPFTFNYSGFVNSEDANVISGDPELSSQVTATSSVSNNPYSIDVAIGTLSASNYSFNLVSGQLNITPATLSGTVTINDKVYDGTTAATIASRSLIGVVGSDDVTLIGGTALFSDKNVAAEKTVSVTALALSGPDAVNYSVNDTAVATANITPAPLAGQIDNQRRLFGQTNPVFTVTYNGFVNGENRSALTGEFVGATPATVDSPLGTYPITGSGHSSINYSITYLDGILTVDCLAMPTAVDDELGVLQDHSVVVTVEKLLANDAAAPGATLSIISVSGSSSNGGSAVLNGSSITFTPATGFNGVDSFTYTLSDGCNITNAVVLVSVLDAASPSANQIGDLLLATDGAHVRFAIIPGFAYIVERSGTNANWTPVGNVVAPADGITEFLDPNPPSGPLYYRTRTP